MESNQLIILYIFFFLGMTAFALLINSILFRFVKTLGTKNQSGAIVRWSEQTKPAIGGLAFYIIFLISIVSYAIIFDPGFIFTSSPILGLFVAGTLGFVLGLTDDAYNTRPFLKLAVQILCGVILTLTNTRIELFEWELMNNIITVLWVVGIMNSINMLDNMDGVATSVSAFILVAALGYMIINGDFDGFNFVIISGILAALIGFLYYNWFPSKMYMGDTGSQFLGVLLGYIGIHYCWNAQDLSGVSGSYYSIATLLLVFILPIVDTTTVTINRLRRGQSPFVGGKDHTTHNLSYLGFTDNQVAGFFCGIGALSVIFYLLFITFVGALNYFSIFLGISYFLSIFILLFGVTEYNKRRNKGVHQVEHKAE